MGSTKLNNVTPTALPFPSLYWPPKIDSVESHYLHHSRDVWRFTFFWTLIIFEGVHVIVSLYALAVQWRNWKMMLAVGVLYMAVAGIEAVLAGSVVGLMYEVFFCFDLLGKKVENGTIRLIWIRLGAIYNAGGFKMSTWIPFVWAWVNLLILIISSFSIHGGL